MRNRYIIRGSVWTLVASLIFMGCQKEIDWGTAVGDQLLVKIVAKTGSSDSTVTVYSYNAQRKLIKELVNSTAAGMSTQLDLIIKPVIV